MTDLSAAEWVTSSYSGSNGGQCVAVARLGDRMAPGGPGRQGVRDTKDRARGTLVFAAGPWQQFVTAVRDGGIT
ncbi:DUF397 domain-containing protein [Streptomyces xiamenensis]